MSTIDEIKEVDEDLADDPKIQEMSGELDLAEELAQFANTPAGKSTIKKLQKSLYSTTNELFAAYRSENPSLNSLVAIIARLESQSSLLAKFTGASSEAETLLTIIQEEVAGKG